MVHRPFRLAEIMTMLVKYKLEPKRMQLVYPYIDKEPIWCSSRRCEAADPA